MAALLDLIPTREAAAILGVDVSTVHRLAKGGQLSSFQLPTGRTAPMMFARHEVEKLAAARSGRPPAEGVA